jgi:hypothetical protein
MLYVLPLYGLSEKIKYKINFFNDYVYLIAYYDAFCASNGPFLDYI